MENHVLSQRLTDPILTDVVSRQFRAAYWLITTLFIHMWWSQILPGLVILSLFTFELHVMEQFLQTLFWCYISVSGHPGVTSVKGGILAHYDWNFSCGWDSPDTKFQLPQRLRIMYHSLNMRNFCSELTPYGPIMAGVVSRQFKVAYWLITSKLIHMSWSQILPNFGYPKLLHIRAIRDWVIPSKLRFDVIYTSVAILASRQFRAAYCLITTKTLLVGGTLHTERFCFLKDRKIMYHSLSMWKTLFWANALRTPYWLT